MEQLSKLTTDVDGTFEVCGITYGYVDIDNIRHIYEMSTKAKVLLVNLDRVGKSIESLMFYLKKPSRIERVKKYIADGIEDKKWLGDRDFLL